MEEATSVVSLIDQGKYGKAEDVLLRWLDKHPEDFHALGNYADLVMRRAHHGLAIHLYRYLLDQWKDMPDEAKALTWANIGQALLMEGFNKEADYAFERAVGLNDKEPGIYNSMAACYVNQGQPDKIIHWCNKALEIVPDMPQALWNRSIGYLEKSEWDKAWPGYLAGDRMTRHRSYKEGPPMRMWDGKRNRAVVVWGEQGLGDEVMFGTCLPDFIKKVKNTIIDCHPRLLDTFKRSFPGIPVYGTRKSQEIDWHNNHKIDSQIAIGSLPYFFRKSAKDFPGTPYLKADPGRIKHYRSELEKLGPGPYVGIAWFGGEKKTRFDYRMIPLKDWGPIRNTGCTFISLQYNKWGHKSEAEKNNLTHWDEPIDNLDEQMALIMACDLVISVCQTAVHFSGALGRECWCLTPSKPAWRYGVSGDYMAWYGKTVKLIRQEEGDDWKFVIREAAQRLKRFKENYAS